MKSRCFAWRDEPLQPFEPTNPFRAEVTRRAPSPLLSEERSRTNLFLLPELADLRGPQPAAGHEPSWVDAYTLEEGLAEVDFFIDQQLVDDALDTLEALVDRFAPAPAIGDRIDRLDRSTVDGPATRLSIP